MEHGDPHCQQSHEVSLEKLDHYLEHIQTLTVAEELNSEFRLHTEGVISFLRFIGISSLVALVALLINTFINSP